MTYRELFCEIMHYGTFDRMPVVHWTGWTETMERWYSEGLPRDVDIHKFLGTTPTWAGIGANLDLYPLFEEEVLEETDEYRIFRQSDGVVCQDWKYKSCIPHYIDFTLKDASNWEVYKAKLQPNPDRLGNTLDEGIKRAEDSDMPIQFWCGSLMGNIRNWMGVENMSYLMYDDRDVYADMVMTIADLTCWSIDQIMPRVKVTPHFGFGWEDICGKSGPLVSPDIFDECVAPGYRKIRNKLEEYGIKLYGIDSDGDVTQLIGHWLEAGVNIQFPIEVGTWQAEGMEFRKKYGKDLRIIGHYNKLVLEDSHEAIMREFDRVRPLMEDGGYILMPDHLITPGVALSDYQWYLDRVRELRF